MISAIFWSLPPVANFLFGWISGLATAVAGYFVKHEAFRWSIAFAWVGIQAAHLYLIYFVADGLPVYVEFFVIAPIFTSFGVVGSLIFKFYADSPHWLWLIMFPLIGFLAAAVYQAQDIVVPIFVLGLLSGGILWKFMPAKYNWSVLFAAIGCLLPWMLFWLRYSLILNFFISIIAGVIGGYLGKLIQKENLRWLILLAIAGFYTGSIVENIYISWGGFPIFLGVLLGASFGFSLKHLKYRQPILFAFLGGLFFCIILFGWNSTIFFSALLQSY